jgi:hypothetical protein
MAPLPNASRAIIDLQKIEDYCLDPTHPRGRHKARVFRQNRRAVIRTVWIVRSGEQMPRFVTCWVL